ncbi:SirA family protein [Sulfobacillus acidophilus TPY]|mgnify:CR=1 FL=1|uniref:SirA-like domain-containing protein n=1 Tax=Sulfobacillus acidophilus (strain ATCC 700253 / DSM 10332 / NAL) TaxID=679936 RepID=G8TWJ1_SULAD|nr:SirA family protein [Sulfobacillus acidophilus TPY]AEW04889.1 SirA-like domain-containing protein [Sulfobacillus acidophilus DSM 10332]MCY0863942.1 sulfurtransferase TusA family protein [Sulfobacillus sp.]
MATENVTLVVDAKGLACPMPVFKAKKGLQSVQIGEVVEVLSTDPGSVADFKAFANSTGHELLLSEQDGTVYRFLLRRAK